MSRKALQAVKSQHVTSPLPWNPLPPPTILASGKGFTEGSILAGTIRRDRGWILFDPNLRWAQRWLNRQLVREARGIHPRVFVHRYAEIEMMHVQRRLYNDFLVIVDHEDDGELRPIACRFAWFEKTKVLAGLEASGLKVFHSTATIDEMRDRFCKKPY